MAAVAPSQPRFRGRSIAVAGFLGLFLLAGTFVGGMLLGDDSSQVDSLQSTVGSQRTVISSLRRQLETTNAALRAAVKTKGNLASQLQAESDLKGISPAPTASSGATPQGDYAAGAAGIVGDFVMKPDLNQSSTSSSETTWTATITVKNNGSNPADLFCGDTGAQLVDSLNRTYDGKAILSNSSANCGDSLQPGLTQDNYVMEFHLPPDARPALLKLSAGEFGDGPTKSWSVAQ